MKRIVFLLSILFPCIELYAQKTRPQILQQVLADANLPGIQLVYTANGKTTAYNAGVGKEGLTQIINSKTIFRAGSLGKCVFAYAVLRLYDRGVLSLDTPLLRYIGSYKRFDAKDPRYSMITARMVLSHTSGLAEFQEFDTGEPVKLLFAPGSSFSYSGEGYWFLQKVLEKLTNKPLEQLMQEEVFKPLRMQSSTYVQNQGMDISVIGPENKDLADMMPNAAFTLLTNAHDYNLFLQALLAGKGLKPATQKLMFSKQSNAQWFGHPAGKADDYINWGLGLGLQYNQKGNMLWHWGSTGDFYSFFIANPVSKQSMVFFTCGTSALKITDQLADIFMGKQTTWAMRWLGLGYDHPETMPRLYNALRQQGFNNVPLVFNNLKSKGYQFSERDINAYGYVLMKQMLYKQAFAIFKQQVAMYPQSANAYDSFAEASEGLGNKQLAINSYKRSLGLDTTNVAARYHIKGLENPAFTADKLNVFTGKFTKLDKADVFLKLEAKRNRIILTQSWDGNKLEFFRIGDLEFYNTDTQFKLRFEKDTSGAIDKAFVTNNVAWIKVK
ncbi:beta-lactamase family protein [Mucilaginibacter rigui]|uniref:Beta-lactamase family protein n=1 Tax=Mucilaginibacter rigui TaxID=534635 RepID=A0ABR7X664_9SPHI|nr:serine hydrolase domain-containing protein [Mucilaginibacter rigui]MBD1386050.1 beta-lactamase family protein [Mucilaginibacter rigui]